MKHPRSMPVLRYVVYALILCAVGVALLYAAWQLFLITGDMKHHGQTEGLALVGGIVMLWVVAILAFQGSVSFLRTASRNINDNYIVHLRHMESIRNERTKTHA